MNITVISDKDTVGFYDMDSKVAVREAADAEARIIPYRHEA